MAQGVWAGFSAIWEFLPIIQLREKACSKKKELYMQKLRGQKTKVDPVYTDLWDRSRYKEWFEEEAKKVKSQWFLIQHCSARTTVVKCKFDLRIPLPWLKYFNIIPKVLAWSSNPLACHPRLLMTCLLSSLLFHLPHLSHRHPVLQVNKTTYSFPNMHVVLFLCAFILYVLYYLILARALGRGHSCSDFPDAGK